LAENVLSEHFNSSYLLLLPGDPVFDRENDRFITAQELRTLLISVGLDSSAQVIRAMIDEADRNRDGKIDFSEFRSQALGK
jgi:Ca2+-binding EF-hand superfamily protein